MNNTATNMLGKVRSAVLAILFGHSDQEFYMRQIVRTAGVGHGAVQRELANLVQAGLVVQRRRGNQVFYQANVDSPVFSDVRGLLIKTAGLADLLKAALAPYADRITVAFVYGSIAKGTETTDSDVDVMVVGNVTLREIVSALRTAQDQLHREISPTVYHLEEFRSKIHSKDHFIAGVLSGEKIFLVGDEDELGRLS